ncbi:hypothetical protein GDI0966 [Gluconacetobacter diazotrophicus PA1 5]|uniref:Uncharacterized protein n=1 Tax=Gluconacetobacter diazotrophicus (strain ATCC 49037 / DSM 5601 / CCUG 37298 / CIP 103539 / LMG 7603 / PAl5) TaxID=272568 RepID=A9HC77_GLUDA|nr:hypothetical protein GDI0966 [Gluconacetobacter diazotrophicus PA1 5]
MRISIEITVICPDRVSVFLVMRAEESDDDGQTQPVHCPGVSAARARVTAHPATQYPRPASCGAGPPDGTPRGTGLVPVAATGAALPLRTVRDASS